MLKKIYFVHQTEQNIYTVDSLIQTIDLLTYGLKSYTDSDKHNINTVS